MGVTIGCETKTQTVSGLDSSCNSCHTVTQVHTRAVIRCTDCHGGNELSADQIARIKGARYGDASYQDALEAAHVHPKKGNEKFFLANGQRASRGACYNANVDIDCNAQNPDGLGSVDDGIDSEYARDLNYVRFINPGDLRVAHASCGGGNPSQGSFSGCHTEEVFRVRRSIMTYNGAVVTAAYVGNRGRLQTPTGPPSTIDPRGYTFDLDSPTGTDGCFDSTKNAYDSDCLLERRDSPGHYPEDDQSKLDPENAPGAFEAFPGKLTTTFVGQTMPHQGHAPRLGGIGGNMLDGTSTPNDHINPVDNKPVASLGISDPTPLCSATPPGTTVEPVDGVLRGFRAYYPHWLSGTGRNFTQVAGSTLDSKVFAFNPYGRGRGSGCSGCHMLYNNDGKSLEPDPAIKSANRQPDLELVEGVNKEQQAMNALQETGARGERKQQRFYPSRHELTTKIPTRQCGLCHTFVTRIDLAYQGISEIEEGDLLARRKASNPQSGDITFTTDKGTRVRIYDNLQRVEPTGQVDADGKATFTITTDSRVKQQRDRLLAECTRRNLDCIGKAIYSADFNNNGELDADEPDLNSGELLLPDRVPREDSVDGRQARILYGGANGSTRLIDGHLQAGMHCIDCHFYQDLHGDGNLYTNNWDSIEIECEDCHGLAKTRAFERPGFEGKLLTSGPNGRNDLMKALDSTGRPFFELRKDTNGQNHLWQRSRVTPGVEWEVKQVSDTATEQIDPTDPKATAHSEQHLPSAPGEGGKLECYSCHNTFTINCLSCHYQQNYKKQQREVFLTGATQTSKTNFQLFGMIRSPLILAVNGTAEHNRISPFRSSMEAYVSVADCDGQTVLSNVAHSNCRSGQPTSGIGLNNTMPHSVRKGITRGCETCHTAKNAQGHVVNNHILAQTYGLGTGRLNYLGDWLFVASSGGLSNVLDVVDIKNESEVPGETSDKNSFPGFFVGNKSGMGSQIRSFALAPSVGTFTPVDVALVRGFNGALCAQEKALNSDIALVAAGTDGLHIFNVNQPDSFTAAATINATTGTVSGNIVGVDMVATDLSDPVAYIADATSGMKTVDLSLFDANSPTAIPNSRVHAVSGWPSATPALGVRVMGNLAVVAAGPAGLITVDVSTPLSPHVKGSPIPVCKSGESLPCSRQASRVTVQGFIAYVASTTGLVAVDLSDPDSPKVLSAENDSPAEDVAISGHLAFIAAGTQGLRILDITDPQSPTELTSQRLVDQNGNSLTLTNAHSVVIGAVPTQTWAFVADDSSGVRAINVSTLFDPYRGRAGQSISAVSADHLSLTLERRDPFMPRDTSVSLNQMPTFTFATKGNARAIARGAMLDRIGDEGGRRLRDSWNPGTGVLSRDTMDKMRGKIFRY